MNKQASTRRIQLKNTYFQWRSLPLALTFIYCRHQFIVSKQITLQTSHLKDRGIIFRRTSLYMHHTEISF
jgi:hypothetical protein